MAKEVATRLYRVRDDLANVTTLVEAANPAQALRIVTARQFRIDVPTSKEVASMVTAGAKVMEAAAS